MKTRTKKTMVGISITLVVYFGVYFLSVRTDPIVLKGQLDPEPFYRPCDAEFIRVMFTPAHLIDAAYLRPSRWASRTQGG